MSQKDYSTRVYLNKKTEEELKVAVQGKKEEQKFIGYTNQEAPYRLENGQVSKDLIIRYALQKYVEDMDIEKEEEIRKQF